MQRLILYYYRYYRYYARTTVSQLMVSGNALIFIMMHTSKITKQLEKLHSNSLFPNVFLHGDGNRGV
jgi:hypothetical protein